MIIAAVDKRRGVDIVFAEEETLMLLIGRY